MNRSNIKAGKLREHEFGAVDQMAAIIGYIYQLSPIRRYNEVIIPEVLGISILIEVSGYTHVP